MARTKRPPDGWCALRRLLLHKRGRSFSWSVLWSLLICIARWSDRRPDPAAIVGPARSELFWVWADGLRAEAWQDI